MNAIRTLSIASPPVITVYLSGFVQGLTLVSFPTVSSVLKQELAFSDTEYGAIFLPQVALAVVGAVAGGSLAQRLGLRPLLVLALAVNALSQLLLAGAAWVDGPAAFPTVLAATAALGFGFGVSGAPINNYPPIFFPRQTHAAVVAAHTLIGLGLSAGPLIAAPLNAGGAWWGFPLLLAAACAALAAAAATLPASEAEAPPAAAGAEERPLRSPTFWAFFAITVLYAFAEGTFANWAVIFLHEGKGLPEMTAGAALSVFWGALVAGRLIISALVTRIRPAVVWAVLPALMIAVFQLLPYAADAVTGIGLFALAGLACSAFLPLAISLASERFPHQVAWVSSMLIAALMVGVGTGSFLIGALRGMLDFADLYRISALYPALVLVLMPLVLRARGGRAERPAAIAANPERGR